MNEKDLINDLKQIDNLLARITCPALNRAEHDAIKQTMQIIAQRVMLSFRLEEQDSDKEKVTENKEEEIKE